MWCCLRDKVIVCVNPVRLLNAAQHQVAADPQTKSISLGRESTSCHLHHLAIYCYSSRKLIIRFIIPWRVEGRVNIGTAVGVCSSCWKPCITVYCIVISCLAVMHVGECVCRALQPPGWTRDWHIGVRVVKSKKLIGFISGVPANIRIYDQ